MSHSWSSYVQQLSLSSGEDTVCGDDSNPVCPSVVNDGTNHTAAGFTVSLYSNTEDDPAYHSKDDMPTEAEIAGGDALPNEYPDAENKKAGLLPLKSEQVHTQINHSARGMLISRSNGCFPRLNKDECEQLGNLDHFNGQVSDESTTQWLQMPSVQQEGDYKFSWSQNTNGQDDANPGMCCRRPERDGGLELPIDFDLMGTRRPE